MNIQMMLYVEINVFGMVVLLTMLFFIVKMQRDTKQADQKLFVQLLACNIGILLSDTIIYMLQWHTAPILCGISYGCCILYFSMHGYFGYLWLAYCIQKLFPDHALTQTKHLMIRIPFFLCFILSVTSPWTGWVFYLTADNEYCRGNYLILVMLLSYLYWAVSAVLTAWEWIRKTKTREKSLYITLLFFPIPTVIGNVLQFEIFGLSVVWICSAVSLMVLFINIQNYQVSRDMLTGLFNRRQTNINIEWAIRDLPDHDDLLFAVIIDVDQFKTINDRFGHLVGDEALRTVAGLLKQSFRSKDYIGRFGGDEFLIVGYTENPEQMEHLLTNMLANVERWNRTEAAPYEIILSAGYSLYDKHQIPTVDQVIFDADLAMYKTKHSKCPSK